MEIILNEKSINENRNKTYTIGQVSQITKMSEGVIRSAEKELGDLLSVSRDEQQNREFTWEDIVMLKKINSVRKWGIGSYKTMKIINEKMNLFDKIDEEGQIAVDTFNIGLRSSISNGIEQSEIRELNYQHSSFSIGDEKFIGAIEMLSEMVASKLGVTLVPQLKEVKETILQEVAAGNSKLDTITENTSEIIPKFENVKNDLDSLKIMNEEILEETKKKNVELEKVLENYKRSQNSKLRNIAKKIWG